MKSANTFTKSGAKATTATKLNKVVFDVVPEKHDLLKQAYTTYLANGRDNLAVTKLRGEVRGGGKKPWRQKGTGRARVGSIRSPIWRGGGITFGPTGEENYRKKMHTAAKRTALRQALSIALDEGHINVIEQLQLKEAKTKQLKQLIDKIGLQGSILIVVKDKTDDVARASRNLPGVVYVQARYLNVYDVVNADAMLIEKDALAEIDAWLGEKR